MDLRTGKMYRTIEEARADGVPESDIAHVTMNPQIAGMLDSIETVEFSKQRVEFTKGSFKPVRPKQTVNG